jgi:hypothetical protein
MTAPVQGWQRENAAKKLPQGQRVSKRPGSHKKPTPVCATRLVDQFNGMAAKKVDRPYTARPVSKLRYPEHGLSGSVQRS